MLCDNPNLLKFLGCRFCSEIICYCKCNLCNRCYCKCQFCGGPHPESVCIYKSEDSDASISSGCHTDSDQESSTSKDPAEYINWKEEGLKEYSDLSKNEIITIDEQVEPLHLFLKVILDTTNPQLINAQTQTEEQVLSVNYAQTQTEGQMLSVNHKEFEMFEKIKELHSHLEELVVDN